MSDKITIVILGVAALVVAALLWVTLSGDPVPERKPVREKKSLVQDEAPAKKSVEKNRAKARPAKDVQQKGKRKKVRKAIQITPVADTYSPEDRKLVDAVQAALDEENLEQTRKAVAEAMKSENPNVRQEAVDALGWYGDKVLVDLTKAMADKDADVAESARGYVENTLMGMEDDKRAVALAGEYVKLFAEDEAAVTMFAGVLSSSGARIIEPDDADSAEDVARAKRSRAGIVEIVAELIGKGGKFEEKGRELYEELAGDAWTSRAAADKWAADIKDPNLSEPEE